MFYVDTFVWSIFSYVASWVGIMTCLTYILIQGYQYLLPRQDLKKKYNASWALVTGGSGGIGAAIIKRLAQQNLNVVVVALDDEFLRKSFEGFKMEFPSVEFRCVPCNLGASDGSYMDAIVSATKDLDVTLVFNNAGYILPGFFAEAEISKIEQNFECNARSAMKITHHFVRQMQLKKRKGLVTFTSSAGAYFPGPTAAMYSATKSFMTSFAISIAGELKDVGIDIVVVHPSPIQSRFYAGTASVLSSLRTAQKAATSPFVIADALFCAAGRLLIYDQGSTCAVFRLVLKTIDFAFFNEITSRLASIFNPDHKELAKKSELRK